MVTTRTYYENNFATRTVNPRGQETYTIYQVFDEPTLEFPRGINHPEGASTEIHRNALTNVNSTWLRYLGRKWLLARYTIWIARSNRGSSSLTLRVKEGMSVLRWGLDTFAVILRDEVQLSISMQSWFHPQYCLMTS